MTETATEPSAAVDRTRNRARPARLSRRWRRSVLVLHIVSAGAWIGIDVIVAVLVLTGWFSTDGTVSGIAYQALAMFVVWPMLTAGLLSLITGLVLGLGSTWGLVRYWWVAAKLALNLVLCTLIVVVLQPGMSEIGDYGRQLQLGATPDQDMSTLFFPPAVSLISLSLATLLAVFKPWGRIRSARRTTSTRERHEPSTFEKD